MPQQYRGERKYVPMRLPVEILDRVEREAKREGITRGDYITRSLALQHGLEVPSYIPEQSSNTQPRLPEGDQRMSA